DVALTGSVAVLDEESVELPQLTAVSTVRADTMIRVRTKAVLDSPRSRQLRIPQASHPAPRSTVATDDERYPALRGLVGHEATDECIRPSGIPSGTASRTAVWSVVVVMRCKTLK